VGVPVGVQAWLPAGLSMGLPVRVAQLAPGKMILAAWHDRGDTRPV
jgi:hypothetical protein